MNDLRDKDKLLGQACGIGRNAALQAIDWVSDNGDVVGSRKDGLKQILRIHALESRRLEAAAVRPTSVAVFGESQAGKSFMIGKFITPDENGAKVIFGEGEDAVKMDFLSEINPQGGKETTGLVTRFSLRKRNAPISHPVELRIARPVDIAKIFANTFVYDLSGIHPDKDLISAEKLDALLAELADNIATDVQTGWSPEDVTELQLYLQESLRHHPYIERDELFEVYWPAIIDILPRLTGEARLKALSPLWGGLHEFDALYRELESALAQLDYIDTAYTTLDAIRDTANGVLHVNRIYELGQAGGAGAQLIQLTSADGKSAMLKMSVVTALTLELRLTLDKAPWDFLRHTDLLDFPGARSRERKTADEILRVPASEAGEHPPREYCFLRGKIAVLFDNYVADFDLNSMLLCVPDSNLNTRELPTLVRGWVDRVIGASPKERVGKPVCLFFCLTKGDRLFELPTGATPIQAIENRLEVNFKEYPGWLDEWTPGRAFDNSYLLRNPKFAKQESLFTYADVVVVKNDTPPETGLNADFCERLEPEFRNAFLSNKRVEKYFANAEAKWEAHLAINDGGVSLLADSIRPVCDPELKFTQVQPRAARTLEQLEHELAAYFESDDIEQKVAQRVEEVRRLMRALAKAPEMIGLFLAEIYLTEATGIAAYLDYRRQLGKTSAASGASPTFSINLFDDPDDEKAEKSEPGAASYGRIVLKRWAAQLESRLTKDVGSRFSGLDVEAIAAIVREMAGAAERTSLADAIDDEVAADAFHQRPDEAAPRVAMRACILVNEFVNTLGEATDREAPSSSWKELDLPADGREMVARRSVFLTKWLKSIEAMTCTNALEGKGGRIDVEQNARLGAILDEIRGARANANI